MTVPVLVETENSSDDLSESNKDEKFTFEVAKVACLSAIGGFLFGYDTGIVSGAMVFIKDDPMILLNEIWIVSKH